MLSAGIAARSWKQFTEIARTHQEIPTAPFHPWQKKTGMGRTSSWKHWVHRLPSSALRPSKALFMSTEIKSWDQLTLTWTLWQLAKLNAMGFFIFMFYPCCTGYLPLLHESNLQKAEAEVFLVHSGAFPLWLQQSVFCFYKSTSHCGIFALSKR